MDNQAGFVQVGADFPYLGNSTLTATGVAQQSVLYRPIGVTMRVTPRINPDGKVLMRVEPTVSSVSPTPVNLGNGINAPAFNIQTVQTTVLASDGETIVLGGMISKQDQRTENGIPFFKDIPYVGALFRFRSLQVQRREVLVIMTPHIMRSEADQARILAEETARIKYCYDDFARMHGHGMEVIGPATEGARAIPTNPGAPNGNYYAPGPAYFGQMAPEGANAAQAQPQPGTLSPEAQPYYPNASVPVPNPNAYQPTVPTAPISVPVPVPNQPGAALPPGMVPPGTPTLTPTSMMPGQPATAMPVMPASAVQPPPAMQPPMTAAPAASIVPMAPTMPAAMAPVPQTPLRSYQMVYPPKPAPIGNGSPTPEKTDRRNTEAREGRAWSPFGR